MKKRLARFFYVYNGHINVNIGYMRKINPFYKLLAVFLTLSILAKVFGLLGDWKEVPLWFMIQVFFLAGVSHFTKLRHEFVKMIPPFIPAKMFWVYFTGVVEIAGAYDLMNPERRSLVAWGLIVFLILVFPANFYAAKNEIEFNKAKPLSVVQRGFVQVVFIAALYVGGIL